jgi:hypothetical protein
LTRAGVTADVLRAFGIQADATATSPLYQHLLRATLADVACGGPCAGVLRHVPPRLDAWAHAVPLRFLGGVHRLVLEGRAPGLARHYGSVGGSFDPAAPGDVAQDFLDVVDEHHGALVAALDRPVQTNEVGRCALLVGGYVEIARRTGLPLRVLEVGTSAGLNLRFDRYAYDTGATRFGDPDSPVRFQGVWEGGALPDLDARVVVAERRGCDASPIDATTDEGRVTLLSFVWPDQHERIVRLRGALDVASQVPVEVEREDAGAFVERLLASPADGVATVVVHSIVLQYLERATLHRLRDAIRAAGARATSQGTVHWLRMEPAGVVADLRLTSWTGGAADGTDEVLATAGFHGTPVWWGRPPDPAR